MRKKLVLIMIIALSSLMVIPSAAAYTGTNQEPIGAWDVSHGWSYIDYTVTHNGNPSIKCTSSDANFIAETDGAWKATTPGDHIYLSCYAKTGTWANPVGEASGSWFGMDFYISGNLTFGEHTFPCSGIAILYEESELQAGHPTQAELGGTETNVYGYSINGESNMTQVNGLLVHTPFNTDWRQLKWDFTVPSIAFNYIWTDGDGAFCATCFEPIENGICPTHGATHGAIYELDEHAHISGIIPWMGVRDYPEQGQSCWYSEPVMYINPSGAAPTQAPTAHPTAPQPIANYPSSQFIGMLVPLGIFGCIIGAVIIEIGGVKKR